MSKYLIDDQPLIVLPKLAEKVGLNESLFLQQVHYWLLQKRHIKDGYYWTYNSYPEWLKQFPFWSESTLKRTVTSLENKGLIITGNYNSMKIDKTKWYRIDYLVLKEITKDIEEFTGKASNDESVQNDTTNGSKCTDEDVDMNRPIPETTTKTTTKKKDIKTLSPKFSTFDMQASERLFELMLINNPTAKKPNLEKWANDVRLMRERDNRKEEQIMYLIEWSQNDWFWNSNILSTGKLREKFDTLVAKIKSQKEAKESFKKSDNKNNGYAAMDMMLNKFEGGFNSETSESTNNRILISENGSTF